MDLSVIKFLMEENGLYVIPLHSVKENKLCTCNDLNCSSVGKHPLLKYSWKVVATNDFEKVKKWVEKYKNINFAVATGRKSSKTNKNLVIIDVDDREHELNKLLPQTFCYETGKGVHYLFWTEHKLNNSVSLIDNGIDVRATNGYAVVPPSKHSNGKKYKLLRDKTQTIIDLPTFLLERVYFKQEQNRIKKQKINKQTTEGLKQYTNIINTDISVAEILENLKKGNKIPVGKRNETCFRILCAARAKGVIELEKLMEFGKSLINFVDEKENFTEEEICVIVRSVMTYPAYNNCHQNVIKNYFIWLEKNGFNLTEEIKQKIIEIDNKFFNKLSEATENKGILLQTIIDARKQFFEKNGMVSYPNYKTQLFAKKLEELGFKKIRTATKNLWAIKITE